MFVNTTKPGEPAPRTGKARGVVAPDDLRTRVGALADSLGTVAAGKRLGISGQTVGKFAGGIRVTPYIVTHVRVKFAELDAAALAPVAATGTDG
jgi:hypothetical protein